MQGVGTAVMTKRLRRSGHERVLFGVCGGVAEYFGVDVSLVRIGFVLAALLGGPGIVIYLLAAAIMPSQRALPSAGARSFPR